MTHDDLVEAARLKLVERYGSMWQAASQMRIELSGGNLLLAMRRQPVTPEVAVMVLIHTGIDLTSIEQPVSKKAKRAKKLS
jgi:hypothetical protein